MKFLIIAAAALSLNACQGNNGVAKGNFEKECDGLKGTFARVTENEYTCTLPDGTVLKSADKK
jgi:hypothetical protein